MVPGKASSHLNQPIMLIRAVVYWLVFFSIIVHGLSVPALNGLFKLFKVTPIHDDPVEVILLSSNEPLPKNSTAGPQRHSVIVNNRFSRADEDEEDDMPEIGRAMMEYDRQHLNPHPHHYRRGHCNSPHPSDEIEMLQHSEEGRMPPISLTDSQDSLHKRPTALEMPNMI